MRILVVTQYYYPEVFKSTDLAENLVKRGHQVTVLTGLPNYPTGKIFKGYGYFKRNKKIINGVRIVRTWIISRGNGGKLGLILNYVSWPLFASARAITLGIRHKYDVIIVHAPSPLSQFIPALLVKKMQRIPIYFWVLDLWPEAIKYAGGINNKFVLRIISGMMAYFYTQSHTILIGSKGFHGKICESGNYHQKIVYFPNWSENSIVEGDRNHKNVPDLPLGFNILFAGNLGESQGLESVILAISKLKQFAHINLILVGDGRAKSDLIDLVEELGLTLNVKFYGKFPIECMTAFFTKADCLLISLRDEPIFSLTVPAKLQAYMSAGKPILGMLNGEGNKLIIDSKSGLVVNAGDYTGLSQNMIRLFQMDETNRQLFGKNGKDYYDKFFSSKICFERLDNLLTESCDVHTN